MYKIEYYKLKQLQTVTPEVRCNPQNEVDNLCWNIKSLTIDMEDIKMMYYSDVLSLNNLFWRLNRLHFFNQFNSLTILNNNFVNKLLIYYILKSNWLINMDCLDDRTILKKSDDLETQLNILYNRAHHPDFNTYIPKIMRQISLLEYSRKTLQQLNKKNSDLEKHKSLKLGKHFIRDKH